MKRIEQQSILDLVAVYEKAKGLIESIIDELNQIILIVDERGFIYRGNKTSANFIGVEFEKVLGTQLSNGFGEDASRALLFSIQQIKNGAKSKIQIEVPVSKTKGTGIQSVLFEIQPLSAESNTLLFIMIGTDVTEYRDSLRKREQMEQQLDYMQKKNLRLELNSVLSGFTNENSVSKVMSLVLPQLVLLLKCNFVSYYEYNELQGVLKRLNQAQLKNGSVEYVTLEATRRDEISLQREDHWLVSIFRRKQISWHSFVGGIAGDLKAKSSLICPFGHENGVYGLFELRFYDEVGQKEFVKELMSEFTQGLSSILYQIELRSQLEEKNLLLENASKMVALGEMSGGIAHEINNPLTVVYGRLRSILSLIRNGLFEREKFAESLEVVLKNLDRITQIVKGLRVFSREGMVSDLVPTELRGVIDGTILICKDRLERSNVPLQFGDFNNLILKGNETQLIHALVHLIFNSIDAIEGSPSPWIKLNVSEDSNYVYIYITDSGSGIPEEHAKKVLLPFFTTKEPGKGTGLGLNIAFGIVKAHGGDLYLNHHCLNTQFVIKLPRN